MREVLPGVALVPGDGMKGFGYAHVARRPGGNLFLDASRVGSFSDAFGEIEAMGGIRAVVISDRHLGGVSTNQLRQRFGAAVYCSDIEAAAMNHRSNAVHIDQVLPFERTVIEGDVLLVPTPGHTEGQFSTLVAVEGARLLFTADFVWRHEGRWRPGNPSRRKMRASLEGLRDLDFDAVVPWTAYDQDELFVPVRDVQATVDEMLAALTRP